MNDQTDPITGISSFASSYAEQSIFFLGRGFCERLGVSPGDAVVLSATSPQAETEAAPAEDAEARVETTVRANYVAGNAASVISLLDLKVGDTIGLQGTKRDAGEVMIQVSCERRATESPVNDSGNRNADALSGDADGTKLPVILGFATGVAASNGGVNTANMTLLEALKGANFDSHLVLTEVPADNATLSIADSRIHDLAKSEGTCWVVGHGVWSGALAQRFVDQYREDGARSLHVVHTAPLQIAAARGSFDEGRRALVKHSEETALIENADLVAFVGNSGSDYPRVAARDSSLRILLHGRADLTPCEPSRGPTVGVLVAGRLADGDVKGVEIATGLIEASNDFRTEDGFRLSLTLCGIDSEDDAGGASSGVTELRSSFLFLPYLDRGALQDRLDSCSVVVMPSAADAFGLIAGEALAHGRPCLVSDLAGVAELYRDAGFQRWVISSDDPSEWARRVQDLVDSPQLMEGAVQDALKLAKLINEAAYESLHKLGRALTEPAALAESSWSTQCG